MSGVPPNPLLSSPVQLDGNFRYMQSHLTAHHTERLERAKQTAAWHQLRQLSLSAHSDLSGQEALCLQTVLLRAQGDTLRDLLDAIGQFSQLAMIGCTAPPGGSPRSECCCPVARGRYCLPVIEWLYGPSLRVRSERFPRKFPLVGDIMIC